MWSFVVAVMLEASGVADTVQNAAIAIVDEDRSALTGQIAGALMRPWFQEPAYLSADQAAAAMDRGEIMLALAFPSDSAADAIAGKAPVAQLLADATAVSQARLGSDYLRNIVQLESLESCPAVRMPGHLSVDWSCAVPSTPMATRSGSNRYPLC